MAYGRQIKTSIIGNIKLIRNIENFAVCMDLCTKDSNQNK
jgi:hypothetical protein